MEIINIYTDGACSGNQHTQNIGGWGAILEYGKHQKELYGGEMNTTNNRMEMTALLESLQSLKKDGLIIHVFSDSSYLMDCFTKKWYVNWQRNGWMTASKKPVENRDLWEKLLQQVVRQQKINFYRVKGHINLHQQSQIQQWFQKFKTWNGSHFTMDDYLYVTKMNILADQLANKGVDHIRDSL